jgi:glycerate 2-kinase
MQNKWIKNYSEIAISKNREIVLDIIGSGLDAISTKEIILNTVKLRDNILSVQGQDFDLNNFEKIKVVGFGKASCDAAQALEQVLGEKINQGAVIGLSATTCNFIQSFAGSHPRPSHINIAPGQTIYDIANNSTEKDLIIAVVSGGGSALLCYPESECIQGEKLYDHFLKSGQTIIEMNTVRKHLSLIKGGGLARIAYPATVIGLIFSDVPGDAFDEVASGPTFKDMTTTEDAQNIITKYDLGEFDLNETPKEDKYFEKVHNFICVSNKTAIEKMTQRVESLGLKAKIISTDLYSEVGSALRQIFEACEDDTVVLAAGEPKLKVSGDKGSGGRNLFMALKAIDDNEFSDGKIFVSLASDGMDNSNSAGAIVDKNTIDKIHKLNIDIKEHLQNFDAYPVFEKSKDMIMTGPTGANVSDLMILFQNNN